MFLFATALIVLLGVFLICSSKSYKMNQNTTSSLTTVSEETVPLHGE